MRRERRARSRCGFTAAANGVPLVGGEGRALSGDCDRPILHRVELRDLGLMMGSICGRL